MSRLVRIAAVACDSLTSTALPGIVKLMQALKPCRLWLTSQASLTGCRGAQVLTEQWGTDSIGPGGSTCSRKAL